MNIKTILGATVVAAGLATGTSAALADGQLRGGMTAVNNVASAIADKNSYASYKWGESSKASGAVVNKQEQSSQSNFKWASKEDGASETQVEGSEIVDARSARVRWTLRNDAEQARVRWTLRNDADQARVRWTLRSDADQARVRWTLRNDADQARVRWTLRNDADQARVRWTLRNDADQARVRWTLR